MGHGGSVEQHSIWQSLLLHLLPGILVGGCYYLLLPAVHYRGYPSLMALMLAAALILVPTQLGYLLYRSKREGLTDPLGVLRYRRSLSFTQYILWVPAVFIALGVIFTTLRPVDVFLKEQLFAWIPALDSGLQEGYSRGALIQTYLMVAIFGVVLAPTVEELYFRGYLLPRMRFAGRWSLLVHSFLFALYHVWTPWMLLTRTLGTVPLAYVARQRSLYVAIVVHVAVNAIDVIVGLAFILGMT